MRLMHDISAHVSIVYHSTQLDNWNSFITFKEFNKAIAEFICVIGPHDQHGNFILDSNKQEDENRLGRLQMEQAVSWA